MTSISQTQVYKPTQNTHLIESVRVALAQGFTGVIKITYLLGEELTILVLHGKIFETMLHDKNTRRHFPGESLPDLFESSRMGYLTSQQTPDRFLLVERACFDSQRQDTQKEVSKVDWEKLFLQFKKHESAVVVLLRWKSAWAFVLVPGSNISLKHTTFFHDLRFDTDDDAAQAMFAWPESHCDITLFYGSLESDAWINIYLSVLFEHLCSYMLNEYGYLTGRAMVNAIIRSMSFFAQKNNLELVDSGSQVQIQTLFSSASEAATAYKTLLGYLEDQMKLMIGSNIVSTMKSMSRNSLNSFYFNLLKYYDF